MSSIGTLRSVLASTARGRPGPRLVPCSACSSEAARTEGPTGQTVWLAYCEPCGWKRFLDAWEKRVAAVGAVSEPGLGARAQAERATKLQGLEGEKRRYLEGRRARELAAKTRANGPLARRDRIRPGASPGPDEDATFRRPVGHSENAQGQTGAAADEDDSGSFSGWLASQGITIEQFEARRAEQVRQLEAMNTEEKRGYDGYEKGRDEAGKAPHVADGGGQENHPNSRSASERP